jgi:hypothetical protein
MPEDYRMDLAGYPMLARLLTVLITNYYSGRAMQPVLERLRCVVLKAAGYDPPGCQQSRDKPSGAERTQQEEATKGSTVVVVPPGIPPHHLDKPSGTELTQQEETIKRAPVVAVPPGTPPHHLAQGEVNLVMSAEDPVPNDARLILKLQDKGGYYEAEVMGRVRVREVRLPITSNDVDKWRRKIDDVFYTLVRREELWPQSPALADEFAKHALRTLAETGRDLWMSLLGDEKQIRGALETLETEYCQIHIETDKLHLPWQLLYDRNPEKGVTPEGFWGFRHVLTTRLSQDGQGPRNGNPQLGQATGLKVVSLIDASLADGNWVKQEISSKQTEALENALKGKGVLQQIEDVNALRSLLTGNVDFDLIYMLCHFGMIEASNQREDGKPRKEQALQLKGVPMTIEEMRHLTRERKPVLTQGPAVLLNACSSAPHDAFTYIGLTNWLIAQGARAVVATEYDIPTNFGARFGIMLFERLMQGEPLGLALRNVRRTIMREYQNPLGLLYALLGIAELRVEQQATAGISQSEEF